MAGKTTGRSAPEAEVTVGDRPPGNLPLELTSFVGREREVAAVRYLLLGSRLLTLIGSGGCGKTRLALHVAEQDRAGYADGVWWVDLSPIAEDGPVVKAVASALGLREEGGKPLLEVIVQHLQPRSLLLVIDNCEHVLKAVTRLVDWLLRQAPHLTVLATSRAPLEVPGELPWRVPSLSLPPHGLADAERLIGYDGIRLFAERALRTQPDFRLDADTGGAVSQICRRLDGIPLAIELAAARMRLLTPPQIATGIDDRFRLLTGGSPVAMARQQTLRASVDWSHDLLSGTEQMLFRRLSVFAGGFTLEAVEEVCPGDGLEGDAILDLLSRLVDQSLVGAEQRGASTRFFMLETIRQYARERATEAGEEAAVRSRHLRHYLELAETIADSVIGPDQTELLRRLELEHDNLRGAMEYALGGDDSALALRLAFALTFFWSLHGHFTEAGAFFDRALAMSEAPTLLRARALWGRGYTAWWEGDVASAAESAAAALEIGRGLGDPGVVARALNTIGTLHMWADPEGARPGISESIELAQEAGDTWCTALSLQLLAWTYVNQDDHIGAAPRLVAAISVPGQRHNRQLVAWYLLGVGMAANRRGDFPAAIRNFEEATAPQGEIGDVVTRASALGCLARVRRVNGDLAEARRLLDSALAGLDTFGTLVVSWFMRNELAMVELWEGRLDEAEAQLEHATRLVVSQGNPYGFAYCSVGAADLRLARGDLDGAARVVDETLAVAHTLNNLWFEAAAANRAGRIARLRGDIAAAETEQHRALALNREGGYLPDILDVLDELAALEHAREDAAPAIRLLSASTSLRRRMSYLRSDAHSADVGRLRAELLVALGDGAEAIETEGAALDLDAVVAYASRARGVRRRPSAGWGSLTPTEIDVVRLASTGLTNPQIAQRMFIARGTVKVHLAHIFTKLGVTTRAELAAEAARRGFGDPDQGAAGLSRRG